MAYVNTGYARNKTLTVTKGSDLTHNYNLCSGFTALGGTVFPSLTDDGLAKLSETDYETRLRAFIEYVYSLETGLETDCPDMTSGCIIYDPDRCQLPGNGGNDESV